MVMLEETPYNQKDWLALKEQSNPQVATAYPSVEVFVGVNKAFHDQAPGLIAFLDRYQTTNALISELLSYMEQSKADERGTAIHFLKTRPEIWTQWVPKGVAQKVEASLK
jgi:glycine betaine/proline transport system substrate-binding protein